MKTRFFATPQGNKPVRAYLNDQEVREAAKILAVLDRIHKHGLHDPFVHTRQLRGKLWEIKISRHRLLYVLDGEGALVLLHAFAKQGQRTPRNEIDTAVGRLAAALAAEQGRNHVPSIKKSSPSTRKL